MSGYVLLRGDCRERMALLDEASVDAIVCDPPYELTTGKKGGSGAASVNLDSPYGRARIGTGNGAGGFMGQKWDATGVAHDVETWRQALRVLKPGGHLLAFSGTRTYHRMVCAIEDAGFEIRDQIGWLYGSGFPKSLDVSKAIDKAAGATREVLGRVKGAGSSDTNSLGEFQPEYDQTAPATDAARQWQGWGTALKPAWEPIVVARKPLIGTVAANVLAHGTGAINVDGCRVAGDAGPVMARTDTVVAASSMSGVSTGATSTGEMTTLGRWPANIIHDGSDEVLAAFPQAPGQLADISSTAPSAKTAGIYGPMKREGEPSADSGNEGAVGFKMKPGARRLDDGSAARFFYCAKASKRDRGEDNIHPTVKPTELMRYLCRLVTPPGGLILDPFTGSGSTGKAAVLEGFNFIGCELSDEYADIAELRIGSALFGDLA